MSIDQHYRPTPEKELGKFDQDPQLLGLIDQESLEVSMQDPSSILNERSGFPAIVPLKYATEANQVFLQDGYEPFFIDFYNSGLSEDAEGLKGVLSKITPKSSIAIELRHEDTGKVEEIKQAMISMDRRAVVSPGVYDAEYGTLASVTHFFSDLNFEDRPGPDFESLDQSYEHLGSSGEWQKMFGDSVKYVSGDKIDPDLLEKLWYTYDKTFDKLTQNHPSAQKQPREYFDQQILLPESKIIYVEKEGRVVSELFLIDGLEVCPWLNKDYFDKLNPRGRTVFSPGISTTLDMQGMNFSELTIRAMSELGRRVPGLTGFATQCTNRSENYVPVLANKFTEGSANLQLKETACYDYPVLLID